MNPSDKTSAPPNLATRLRGWLLTGIAVVAPATITIYIIVWLIGTADSWYASLVPAAYDLRQYIPFQLPGFGLLWTLLVLMVTGAVAQTFFARAFISAGERLVDRMPVVSGIYAALRDIFNMVLSSESPLSGAVGLVEYPRKGSYVIAFITVESKGEVQAKTQEDVVGVFVPTTPNPTSGFFLYVPRKDIIPMQMSVEDAAKLIVTAGLVEPAYEGKKITQPERK